MQRELEAVHEQLVRARGELFNSTVEKQRLAAELQSVTASRVAEDKQTGVLPARETHALEQLKESVLSLSDINKRLTDSLEANEAVRKQARITRHPPQH